MATSERPIVVMDITAAWAVDAAFFFTIGAGFLAWGLIARSATKTILSFAIMATVAMLVDRVTPLLPKASALTLAQAHDRPPDGAVQRTWKRYTAEAAVRGVALTILYVVLVVYVAPPGFLAGWMTAYGVSRLRGVATVREIERTSGVRLSYRVQRSIWRARTPAYYATPRLSV